MLIDKKEALNQLEKILTVLEKIERFKFITTTTTTDQ